VQAYLSVSVRERGESVIVEVGGELDLASSPDLERVLDETLRPHPGLVVVEMGKLNFIDMSGLRVLLSAQQRAEERGTRLVLANVRSQIRRVMALARVDDLLTVLETAP
jgi:anti-sigma B factor antagonist